MKKKDLILGAGIIVIALAMLLVMQLTRGEEGNQIQITLDGKIYGTYSLSKDQTIEVKDGDFYNRIRIEDGRGELSGWLLRGTGENQQTYTDDRLSAT
jgi:hypothetical protein